jgi:hypothetical protein
MILFDSISDDGFRLIVARLAQRARAQSRHGSNEIDCGASNWLLANAAKLANSRPHFIVLTSGPDNIGMAAGAV